MYHGATKYGGRDEFLYKKDNLHEKPDDVNGVAPVHYADVGRSESQKLAVRAYMGCEEYAVIGFWDLDLKSNSFKCSRFFIIPSPVTRVISMSLDTALHQVLYSSPHNKEVFFFFRGHQVTIGQDIEEDIESNE